MQKEKGRVKDGMLAIGVKDKYRPCWMGTTSEASSSDEVNYNSEGVGRCFGIKKWVRRCELKHHCHC